MELLQMWVSTRNCHRVCLSYVFSHIDNNLLFFPNCKITKNTFFFVPKEKNTIKFGKLKLIAYLCTQKAHQRLVLCHSKPPWKQTGALSRQYF